VKKKKEHKIDRGGRMATSTVGGSRATPMAGVTIRASLKGWQQQPSIFCLLKNNNNNKKKKFSVWVWNMF
jgi:hypothetical protein